MKIEPIKKIKLRTGVKKDENLKTKKKYVKQEMNVPFFAAFSGWLFILFLEKPTLSLD